MHPIETANYVIPTTAIEDAYDAINEWIDVRCTGAVLYGTQRIGKTWAIRFFREALAQQYPNIFVFQMECQASRPASEGRFFSNLLKAAGHALWKKGSILDRRDRLIEFLVDEAREAGDNRIVLFLDEAQTLRDAHYVWLMELHNDIERLGLRLIVFLIGQAELIAMRKGFLLANRKQIVGRFMIHTRPFHGLKSVRETKRCLRSYDEAEFPPGCTFTQHYFPMAWEKGWRLEHEADEIWSVLSEKAHEAGVKSIEEVPMKYFAAMVELLLRNYGEVAIMDAGLTRARIEDAAARSGCIDALCFQ